MSSIGQPKYYPAPYGYSTFPDPNAWHMEGQRIILNEWKRGIDRGDHRATESSIRALNDHNRQYCCMCSFASGLVGVSFIITGVMGGETEDTGLIVIGSICAAIGFLGMCYYCLDRYYGR